MELGGLIILIYVVSCFVTGGLSFVLAVNKGYSPGAWFLCGFLFGIPGLIAAAGLPLNPDGTKFTKRCSQCGELVDVKALICKYCGRKFVHYP